VRPLGSFGLALVLGIPGVAWSFQALRQWQIDGSTITVSIGPENPPLSENAIMHWVKTCARAVADYYGRFPVPEYKIEIFTEDRGHIHHGVTYEGRRTTIDLGRDTSPAELERDWELTHEMLHLAFPQLDDEYDWMGEGLSDYIEPIARARIGILSDEILWRDLVEGLPKGLPQEGDKGLDRTPTWGRIYWGGAMYWFLADLKIREETHNQRSIRDALIAILEAGGDGRRVWELKQVLAVGDKATGTTVLHDLHDQMGTRPFAPDLYALWKRLGVVYQDRAVSFDDTAPEAALRRSITAPPVK
jgi:hypothetical protein